MARHFSNEKQCVFAISVCGNVGAIHWHYCILEKIEQFILLFLNSLMMQRRWWSFGCNESAKKILCNVVLYLKKYVHSLHPILDWRKLLYFPLCVYACVYMCVFMCHRCVISEFLWKSQEILQQCCPRSEQINAGFFCPLHLI